MKLIVFVFEQRYEGIILIGDLKCDLSRPDKGTKEGKTLMDLMDVYGLTRWFKYQLVWWWTLSRSLM